MENQKTKLGARVLSKLELEAILPNAESIYEQIEVFRNSIPGSYKGKGELWEIEQKTNNIGIMGCRGAGKTSVLRTFYEELKNRNNEKEKQNEADKYGDIILPIIVPENMSSGTTLMDVVLGMLKPMVEERRQDKDVWQGDCIYYKRDSLEKQYNELVKQYCYIKKDYRDILIQQFTTEQNYLDKTKEVFNSDSEFIKLFNSFVINLLQNDETKADKNSMIFLFIDDIDLSTNRCMDVVRTLLSYLSNPRIVTFISGDMETFEEALTLEFLRQEEALNENVFGKIYYSTNDKNSGELLERKKLLAYEYLKKIIPPAYRRTIKHWSLEERGNYQIIEDENSKSKSLGEFLIEVTKGKLEKAYFVFKDDEEQKYMSLAFHMFDDTARGLNNVYNVLQEILYLGLSEKEMTEKQEMLFIWRLIETMVDSKPLYAKYKVQLLNQIIVLEREQVKVDFANAFQFLYGGEVTGQDTKRFSSKERFTIFFLIEFASRVFSQKHQSNADYINLKIKIVQEYLSDEAIDDKIASARNLIDWQIVEQDKSRNYYPEQLILKDFLKESDFLLILYLIRYLGREYIYEILENREKKWHSAREISYKIAYALARAVCAINETEISQKKYLADMYMKMQDTMLNLLNRISLNPWIMYGRYLTDGINMSVGGKRHFILKDDNDVVEAVYENVDVYIHESKSNISGMNPYNLALAEHEYKNSIYWIYYEKILKEDKGRKTRFDIQNQAEESIYRGITKAIMNQMKKEVMDGYRVKELCEVNYDFPLEESGDEKEWERQVIMQIDKNGLWKKKYVKDKVFVYLEKRRDCVLSNLTKKREIFDATDFLKGAYLQLKDCYKGSSGTALVHRLLRQIQCLMFLSDDGRENMFSDGKYYLRLEQKLVIQCFVEEFLRLHARVRYGKKEIRQFLMEIKELPLVIHIFEEETIYKELEKHEDEFFKACEGRLKDEVTRQFEIQNCLEIIIEKIGKISYSKETTAKPVVESLLAEYVGREGAKDCMYFKYLLQGNQIQKLFKELEGSGEIRKRRNDFQITNFNKDCMFIFHSYLRYLQANDNDVEKAGVQAEAIAMFAKNILDSEIIADEQIQNEVYDIISKEIALTEEEFEKLF